MRIVVIVTLFGDIRGVSRRRIVIAGFPKAQTVTTPTGRCNEYDTLMKVDDLEWRLRQTEGVESTDSLALFNRKANTMFTEGSPKWYDLFPTQSMINFITTNTVLEHVP